ncbi:hypothetical protein LTR84_002663 [Exophiala bonariae]|uniref:Alcohol dehydrogenase-like N-terminal domain-containing protein n=1 Tax=Exophiala bonariae TaxID=1690606 RepID=A0AAV9NAR1_9EURO|nr:hypothetical protein LTR84_002663 [Exophiala bonariae]
MGAWPLWERLSSLIYKRHAKLIAASSTKSESTLAEEKEIKSELPTKQKLLLLHGPKQDYVLTDDQAVPLADAHHEVVVRVTTIGLNPIDWKAPAFNFGIPQLPYISGREFSGEIVNVRGKSTRLKQGDRVLVPSTDYRDPRKAAFQQYAIASDFNVIRLPTHVSAEEGATLGVAYVAASLALGVCLGVDFSRVFKGPDLLRVLRRIPEDALPTDVRVECHSGIPEDERAKPGDWIAIWGGSSSTAIIITQLAQLAGLRVISIVDQAKHGHRLSPGTFPTSVCAPDIVIDSHDPARVQHLLQKVTHGNLRFGIDSRGKDTATLLLQSLVAPTNPDLNAPTSTTTPSPKKRAHLVGLTGLPKLDSIAELSDSDATNVSLHSVPIKIFHDVPEVGLVLSVWLEQLLQNGKLKAPQAVGTEDGFEGVNRGLKTMREGGGRVVVRI